MGSSSRRLVAVQRLAGNRAAGTLFGNSPTRHASNTVGGLVVQRRAAVPKLVGWLSRVTKGGQGAGLDRILGAANQKVFVGDKMRVSAEFAAPVHDGDWGGGVQLSAPGGDVTLVERQGKQVSWDITFLKVGHQRASFNLTDQAGAPIPGGTHDEDFGVVADLADFIMAVQQAQSELIGKFAAAQSKLSTAANAFRVAKADQDAALKDVGAQEKLAEDLVLGALFAAVGGFAGGAVGGVLTGSKAAEAGPVAKALAQWKDSAPVFQGGMSDLAKDTVKFVTRSGQRLFQSGSGRLSTAGDSTAPTDPTQQPGGSRSASGEDPLEFLTTMSARIEGDKATVQSKLSQLIADARQARNANSKADFDEDPMEFVSKPSDVDTVGSGLNTEKTTYLKGLWRTWLGTYGYAAIFTHTRYGDKFTAQGNVGSKLRKAIKKAAAQCGEDGDQWIRDFSEAARAGAEAEAEAKNKRMGYPAPYRPGSGSADRY